MIEQEEKFDDVIKAIPNGRFYRVIGNHDGYWAVSDTEKYTYTRDEIYELFLNKDFLMQDMVYGPDKTYYYLNDFKRKVRFIALNTNGGSIDDTQVEWLENEALEFDESGWIVVLIGHAPITNNFHANIKNAAEVQEIIEDYIESDDELHADIVGWWSGHVHRDRIYQTDHTDNTKGDDQITATLPWHTVVITSDHTAIAYEDATKHAIDKSDNSHAIDFVTINKTSKEVNITRLGIGNDRRFTYK